MRTIHLCYDGSVWSTHVHVWPSDPSASVFPSKLSVSDQTLVVSVYVFSYLFFLFFFKKTENM